MKLKRILSFAAAVLTAANSFVFAADENELQNLIDSAANQSTITLTADSSGIVVPAGKEITIDLNGFNITADSGSAIENNGTLKLIDSKGGGAVFAKAQSADACALYNTGTAALGGVSLTAETVSDGIAHGINNTGRLTLSETDISAYTTGVKWAIALLNDGTADKIEDCSLSAEINNSSTSNVNAVAVSNNEAGDISLISDSEIRSKVNNGGTAYAIRNKNHIGELAGENDVSAETTGTLYVYAVYNDINGVIDKISGGSYTGNLNRESNGNNGLGVSNEGRIGEITGGTFTGKILGGGSAYGLRTRGSASVGSVSGGAFKGNNSANAVFREGGSITYADGYELIPDGDNIGYRYAAEQDSVYTEILDEYENRVAAFIFGKDGNLLSSLGNIKESYEVYPYLDEQTKDTAVVTPADFAENKSVITITEHTTDKPVYYFLGSSVTIGAAANAVSFPDIMAENNGWICIKKAISGTTLVAGNKSYIQRLVTEIPKHARIDHLVTQLSTNDATQNKTLGSISGSWDIGDFNQRSITGAIEYIAAYAKNTWNCDLSFYTNPKFSNSLYQRMIDRLYDTAEKWNFGIIDYYNYKNMEPLPGDVLSSYMSDAIHPNLEGYKWMASVMEKYLESYQPGEQKAFKITLNETSLSLKKGETAKLTAEIAPETTVDKTVSWSSSDSSVASVDQNGTVTAFKAGTAVITAKTANGKTASCKVTVTEPQTEKPQPLPQPEPPQAIKVTGVKITGKKTVTAGSRLKLKASVSPSNAADKGVVWSSSNSKKAPVSQNGTVTAKKPGKFKITAAAKDGSGKKHVYTITVKPKKVSKIKTKVKNKKLTVSFKKIAGVKKYSLNIYRKNKKIKTVTVKKNAKAAINKKLKKGSYTVKIRYTQNGVKSDYAVKRFKVR